MTLAIIPAAGFGTRMNMAPDQSKEMLIDSTGKPVIRWCLDRCQDADISPLVVTRKEKKDLIQYLQDNSVPHMIIKPQGEWMDTVLATEDYWQFANILFLPDVRFTNTHALLTIKTDLEFLDHKVSIGHHFVDDCTKWGMVDSETGGLNEKPPEWNSKTAWGILGFNKSIGIKLFDGFKRKGTPFFVSKFPITYLGEFKDITRSGKLE